MQCFSEEEYSCIIVQVVTYLKKGDYFSYAHKYNNAHC